MVRRVSAVAVMASALVCGQHRFSWQEECFKHPAAPYCPGHEYAVKPAPAKKDTGPRRVVSNPFSTSARSADASIIEVASAEDGIDWRFADPEADALMGFHVNTLCASAAGRDVLARVGASLGLGDGELQRALAALSRVDQVAISVSGQQKLILVTGPAADPDSVHLAPGVKAVAVSGSAILIGPADAADRAVQRIRLPLSDDAALPVGKQMQDRSDLWAIGPAALAGPQAVAAGVERVTLALSARDSLTGNLFFEFEGAPGAKALRILREAWGPVSVEGNVARVSPAFGDGAQFVSAPAGQSVEDLLEIARWLPVPAAGEAKARPVIYGLDEPTN